MLKKKVFRSENQSQVPILSYSYILDLYDIRIKVNYIKLNVDACHCPIQEE